MTPAIEIESRESVPRWLDYGAPVLTVLAALLVASVPLLWIGANPIFVYEQIFLDSLLDLGGIADILTTATPLFLAGLAVYIPLKAGLWNIGAEGQLYVGAIVGTYIGLSYDFPSYVLLALMMLASGLAAALYAAIPGYLRAEHDVNEIISSLMLTFAATTFTGYLLRGPLQGRGGQTATNRLSDAAELPTVLHPRLHVGVGILAIAAVLGSLFLTRTRLGYEITYIGSNPAAAKQAGISSYKIYILVFLVGGFLAGLAGIIEIAGVHGRLFESFSPGYGFTAVAVALLGRNGVFRVLLAALFFGVLTAGGTTVAITMDVPNALVDVIVALTILFLLTAEFITEYRLAVTFGGKPDTGSEPSMEGSA